MVGFFSPASFSQQMCSKEHVVKDLHLKLSEKYLGQKFPAWAYCRNEDT